MPVLGNPQRAGRRCVVPRGVPYLVQEVIAGVHGRDDLHAAQGGDLAIPETIGGGVECSSLWYGRSQNNKMMRRTLSIPWHLCPDDGVR